MRVCFVSLFGCDGSPLETLEARPMLRRLPAAVAKRGHAVSVLHVAPRDVFLRVDRVRHHFVPVSPAVRIAALAASVLTRLPRSLFEVPLNLPSSLLRSADIIHVHGTQHHLGLAALRRALPAGAGLVVHYHGGAPTRRVGVRGLQRRNMKRADAVLFTTAEQADAFGLREKAELLVETSSDFGWMDRRTAREKTGMVGSPVCLSAARLHPVKDPLTMLRGFERIAASRPNARLYLYYLSDELLPELRAFVDARPALQDAVHFRGRVERSEMEAVFNSADILLQASLREYSGCAVLDAIACGVIPVVTDLPPFRAIAGPHGAYFPAGDPEALARRALEIDPATLPQRAGAVREHFERNLSYPAMAERLETIYTRIHAAGSTPRTKQADS